MGINFNKPFLAEHGLEYVTASFQGGQVSGDGPFTRRCHQWLEQHTGCQRALLTHSCTAALEMAAILADLQAGDEVIMPSYTFVSTANAFVLRGAVPVFVDIRPDTLNIDEQRIEAAITPRTRAIVVVHYAGVACEMGTIMAIAERHGLLVIEDAAQAIHSTYRGRALGTIGHMGTYSFHETKNIICGEGGALLVNDPAYVERAEIIREKGTNRSKFFRGQVDKYTWVDLGSSYLPSDILAALLYSQLESIDEIIAQRLSIWQRYDVALRPLAQTVGVQCPSVPEDDRFNGHIYYLILPSLAQRAALIDHLRQHEVMAVFHYIPLHSAPAGRRYARAHGELPVTDRVSDCLVRLPLYHQLSDAEQQRVIELTADFLRGMTRV